MFPPLGIAINTLPHKEKKKVLAPSVVWGYSIHCKACEIPWEIYKEGWMQKTPFPNSWQLASHLIICSLPREYVCASQCYPLKIGKIGAFLLWVPASLPIISSTQGEECFFGVGGVFVIFWEFHENYSSTEHSPEEVMKMEEGQNCLLTPLTVYSQNIFWLFVSHQPLLLQLFITEKGPLCKHNKQRSVSFQRAFLKAESLTCPTFGTAPFFHKKRITLKAEQKGIRCNFL